jgi:hypothetical protein
MSMLYACCLTKAATIVLAYLKDYFVWVQCICESFAARLAAHSVCSDAAHCFARVARHFYTSDYNVRVDFQIRIIRDSVICKRITP